MAPLPLADHRIQILTFGHQDAPAQSRGERDGRVVVQDRVEPRGRTGDQERRGRREEVERRDPNDAPRP